MDQTTPRLESVSRELDAAGELAATMHTRKRQVTESVAWPVATFYDSFRNPTRAFAEAKRCGWRDHSLIIGLRKPDAMRHGMHVIVTLLQPDTLS